MGSSCDLVIVDDQPGVLRLLEEAFGDDGYNVLIARDGRRALELVSSENPRAVLLDMKMPDMDGKEILREIRKIDRELPVVVMTAYDKAEVLDELQDEVQHCISKPFDLNDIRSIIKDVTGF